MKSVYDNEGGFALILALILSLVVLAVVSGLLYLITQGTAMSGYQKRYETALEGAKGGVDLVTKEIIPQAATALTSASALSTLESTLTTTYGSLQLQFPSSTTSSCLLAKLTTSTLTGSTDNWQAAGCTYDMEANYLINPTTGAVVPDVQFVLQGPTAAQNFIVYAKIVDTVVGGTYMGPDLLGAGVTELVSQPGQQAPNIYRIEVQAQRQQNPDEKSNLSVLYAY